ncbi:MAG: hypothetical protein EAX96_05645 [Candidatus Lokiarchaeota archaeon]|nr:hypothetical protein [Candidatus Lokiarchaeota archaeon]
MFRTYYREGVSKLSHKKVLFVGLDNAGKTSFINALDRKNITDMKPTLGIDLTYTNVLGFKLARWDCGGQVNYRESYFREEANVFADADIVFFIIDVQEERKERIEEALKYYEDILEVYKLIGEKPAFIICLHKFDPDLIFYEEGEFKKMTKRLIELEERFKNISKDLGFDFKIVQTSLFDRESLIRGFSTGIKAFLTQFDLLDLTLTDFAEEMGIEKVLLYEKNSLIIGESAMELDAANPLNTALMEFMVILDELSKREKEILKLEISVDDKYSFVIFSKKFKNFNFYLGVLGNKNLNFMKIIEIFDEKYSSRVSDIIKELV